ncbi:MAG: type VI secretion system protein TssA [Telluria sp.]
MAAPDIDRLLAPVEGAAPCGPNLEYEASFMALAATARGKPGQQIGSAVVPPEPPDWRAVRDAAATLLASTKDLRVALLLARALVHTAQLPGLRDGLALVHGLLERYWEEVHPVPEADDPGGAIVRVNALAPLADPAGLLGDVRNAAVGAAGAHGTLTVRDIVRTASRRPPGPGETVLAPGEIAAALGAAAAADPSALGAAAASAGLVKAIQATLADRLGSTRGPDLEPLLAVLGPVAEACGRAAEVAAPPAPPAPPVGAAAPAPGPAPAAPVPAAVPGEIRSREEARQALDSVCRFYEQNEPGNPAPLLIRRAQRLIDKSFVEILQDLAPDSLAQVRTIAGLPAEEKQA